MRCLFIYSRARWSREFFLLAIQSRGAIETGSDCNRRSLVRIVVELGREPEWIVRLRWEVPVRLGFDLGYGRRMTLRIGSPLRRQRLDFFT